MHIIHSHYVICLMAKPMQTVTTIRCCFSCLLTGILFITIKVYLLILLIIMCLYFLIIYFSAIEQNDNDLEQEVLKVCITLPLE